MLVSCAATLLRLHETRATALDAAAAAAPMTVTVVLEGLCLYGISGLPGVGAHFRITAHDLTLAEALREGEDPQQAPVLYKNKWVPPPPSHSEGDAEPPLVVLDLVNKEGEEGGGSGRDRGVLSAYLDLYGVALRLRVESQWLPRTVTLLAGGVETLAPAARGGAAEQEAAAAGGKEERGAAAGSDDADVMRVFCTAYDSVVDFAAPSPLEASGAPPAGGAGGGEESHSRSVLSFGLARASSTLVAGAPRQAYKAMLRDLVLHMSGEPADYSTEDAALLGSRRLGLSPSPPPPPAAHPVGGMGMGIGGSPFQERSGHGWRFGAGPIAPGPSDYFGASPLYHQHPQQHYQQHQHHHPGPVPAPALLGGLADPYRPQHYHYPLPSALLPPSSPAARAEAGASVQQCLERRGFVQLATLNFVDASLRCVASSTPILLTTEPAVTVELSIGLLLLYTCGDSFTTLQEALGGAWCRLQAESDRLERVRLGLPPMLAPPPPPATAASAAATPARAFPGGGKQLEDDGDEAGPKEAGMTTTTIAVPVVGVPRSWTDEVVSEAAAAASNSGGGGGTMALPIAITAGAEQGEVIYGSSQGSRDGGGNGAGGPCSGSGGSARPKSYLEDIDEEMFVPTAGDAVAATAGGSAPAAPSAVGPAAPATTSGAPLAGPAAAAASASQQQQPPPPQQQQQGEEVEGINLGQMLIDDFYEMSAGGAAANGPSGPPSSSQSGGEGEGTAAGAVVGGAAPSSLLGLGADEREEGWGGWLDAPGVDLRAGQRGQHPDIFDEGFLVEVDEFDTGDGGSRPGSAASGRLAPADAEAEAAAAAAAEGSGDGGEDEGEDEDELSVDIELDPGVPGGLFADRGGGATGGATASALSQRRLRRMSLVEGMGPEMELDPLGALHDGKGGLGLLSLHADDDDDEEEDLGGGGERKGRRPGEEEELDATDLSAAAAAAAAAASGAADQPPPPPALQQHPPPPPPPGPPPPGAPDDAAWAWHSEVTPGQEQCSRWFVEGVRVFPHHVPQPAEELLAREGMDALALVPFEEEKDGARAQEAAAAAATTASGGSGMGGGGGGPCPVQFRLVLHDVSVRWRMFAGQDWGEPVASASSGPAWGATEGVGGAVTSVVPPAGYRASERLRGLFGEEEEDKGAAAAAAAGASQSPQQSQRQRRRPPPAKRWRKKKGQGRKTDCMVEVCLSHVSARLDGMVPGVGKASATVVRVLDFHVLDRINTVQPRRILGYWCVCFFGWSFFF